MRDYPAASGITPGAAILERPRGAGVARAAAFVLAAALVAVTLSGLLLLVVVR